MMRKAIVGVLLAGLSLPVFAHDRDNDGDWDNDRDYRNQRRDRGYEDYGRNNGRNSGYGYGSGSAVNQSLNNLSRLSSRGFLNGSDRNRLSRAVNELQAFNHSYQQGKFDNGRLDRAIDNMKPLADSQRIDPRDRQMLRRDIEELRAFRASGGRYSNGSYGNRPYRYPY